MKPTNGMCIPFIGSIAVQWICYHMESRVTVTANNICSGNNLIIMFLPDNKLNKQGGKWGFLAITHDICTYVESKYS